MNCHNQMCTTGCWFIKPIWWSLVQYPFISSKPYSFYRLNLECINISENVEFILKSGPNVHPIFTKFHDRIQHWILSFVNSQIPYNCSFKGVDYGVLSNVSFSAESAENPMGRYRYYWSICGVANDCDSSRVSACLRDYSDLKIIGNLDSGTFIDAGQFTQLRYYSLNLCSSSYRYKSMTITFKCSAEAYVSTSRVYENQPCYYTVEMSGIVFCPNVTPTEIPTLPPTTTPTETSINETNVAYKASNGISMARMEANRVLNQLNSLFHNISNLFLKG
ncbi:hypothetical protein ACTA71_011898 [Dictyostelium dimigraforme]